MFCIDRLVGQFFDHFNKHYEAALATDFTKMDLVTQMDFLKHIYKVCCLVYTYITSATAVVG